MISKRKLDDKNMVTFTSKIKLDTVLKMDKYKEKIGISLQRMINDALEAYFKTMEKK